MITKLSINSFKSLAPQVDVDLGQINVFIGANGSGKSNILEALGVLGAAASGRVDDESLLRRGVRPGVPALYKSSFKNAPTSKHIRFTAEWSDADEPASYAVGLWNPIEDPEPAWKYKHESWQHGNDKIVGRSPASKGPLNQERGEAALRLVDQDPEGTPAALLRALQDYVIYTPTTVALRGLVPDPQQREPVGLSGGRLPEAVGELLRLRYSNRDAPDYYKQVCDEVFELIHWTDMYASVVQSSEMLSPSVPSGRRILQFRDRYMASKRNVLTSYDASEGALYVLLAAVLSAHPKVPSVIAVDNFDHGLNPRLARGLIERFCGWVLGCPSPRQLLLTTHNPLVLDGLDLTDERIRLFTVDRSTTGRTVVNRVVVDDKMLEKAKEGWTLSRLWVMGMIGGVPDV